MFEYEYLSISLSLSISVSILYDIDIWWYVILIWYMSMWHRCDFDRWYVMTDDMWLIYIIWYLYISIYQSVYVYQYLYQSISISINLYQSIYMNIYIFLMFEYEYTKCKREFHSESLYLTFRQTFFYGTYILSYVTVWGKF